MHRIKQHQGVLFAFVLLASSLISFPFMETIEPAAAQDDCTFTGTLDVTPLYTAPLTDPTQQADTILSGVSYPVTLRAYEHFYIELDNAHGGWVDRRSGITEGACDAVPLDETPLTDYPTVCAVTLGAETTLYAGSALAVEKDAIPAGVYVVTMRTDTAYNVRLGHAYGGWIASSDGQLKPNCDRVPPEPYRTATALDNARVWSAPDVASGSALYTLEPGQRVLVVAGPVRGPIRFDTDDQGDWYQVYVDGQASGWVWSERLTLSTEPPPPPNGSPTGTTQPNARLWSAPTVRTGELLVFLDEGTPVTVNAGPVRGPIRYDTDHQGDWYHVTTDGGLSGWVWSERLTLD
jgi:hypothetical protein